MTTQWTDPVQIADHTDEPWRAGAACQEHDPAIFFPDDGSRHESIALAKTICAGCPVVDDCLSYALETNQSDGVWGGLTATARRRLRQTLLTDYREAS